MKPPKFSIIMPCYNSERYLNEAIKSVLDQKWHNWELILINDGSTDRTLEIIKHFQKSDNRIFVHSKPNGGYVSAVNFGLKLITGDYFLMMGSDDRLDSGLLDQIADSVANIEPDIIAFRTLKVIDNVIQEYDEITNFRDKQYLSNVSIKECEQIAGNDRTILFVRDTSKCFRHSKLNGLQYFGKFGYDADGIFSTLFSQRCTSFLFLPVDGYYWTLREDSLSAKPNKHIDFDRLNNWDVFVDHISRFNINDISQHAKDYLTYALGIAKKTLKNHNAISISELKRLTKIQLKILSFCNTNNIRSNSIDKLRKWRRFLLIYNIIFRIRFFNN